MNPQDVVRRARSERPTLRFSASAFAEYVRDRARLAPSSKLHAGDLALAFLCENGDRAALHVFEREVLPGVRRRMRSIYPSAIVDETLQRLRTILFVPNPAGRKAIAGYRGTGPLASWVKTLARRTAMQARQQSDLVGEAGEIPGHEDPESLLARAGATRRFRNAFHAAVARLSDEERAILEMHYLGGANLEAVAEELGVSRATAARRIQNIRKRLERELRDLEIPPDLGAVGADLSVSRILATARPAPRRSPNGPR